VRRAARAGSRRGCSGRLRNARFRGRLRQAWEATRFRSRLRLTGRAHHPAPRALRSSSSIHRREPRRSVLRSPHLASYIASPANSCQSPTSSPRTAEGSVPGGGRPARKWTPQAEFLGSSRGDIGWYTAVRDGPIEAYIIPANTNFLVQLCVIYSRGYSDCGSREGRGFEPRRSPSHLQVKHGQGIVRRSVTHSGLAEQWYPTRKGASIRVTW
jgi:hypothetical protein